MLIAIGIASDAPFEDATKRREIDIFGPQHCPKWWTKAAAEFL
jgi:hypothetical protein